MRGEFLFLMPLTYMFCLW